MLMTKIRLGLAMCGSYCTYEMVLSEVERLCKEYEVTPLMSENSAATDSRFGKAADFKARLEEMTGKPVLTGITKAEPIGPQAILDVLVIAPCTGNTLAKLAAGVTDTTVTMAAKAQLRNERPVVLALATNDGLAGNAANLGILLARRNVYFVPFTQDDPSGKPRSLMADFSKISDTVKGALSGRQLQPILL